MERWAHQVLPQAPQTSKQPVTLPLSPEGGLAGTVRAGEPRPHRQASICKRRGIHQGLACLFHLIQKWI